MDPNRFLSGRFKLDRDAAISALETSIGTPLGVSAEDAAIGIFSIVNAKMADLVRKVTVERGLDPRDFVLCAYDGLGPLHAPFYGQDLNVKAIMIPLGELSSVFSAYGIATADLMHVRELSLSLKEPFAHDALAGSFNHLAKAAGAELERDGIAKAIGLPRDEQVSLLFCGSQKSLASGIPIANVLFVGHATSMVILPLMIYHQLQLLLSTVIAQRSSKKLQLADKTA